MIDCINESWTVSAGLKYIHDDFFFLLLFMNI